MELHKLVKIITKGKKRLGQGYGSGRGKTAGRGGGAKGQKGRGKVPLWFEGGGRSLIKRLPFLRGKGKNKIFREKPIGIKLSEFKIFKKNAVVDIKALVANHIIEEENVRTGVKILADGDVDFPLTVKLPVSQGAKKKIEKVGGRVERD